jgi:hypothetical protein
VRIIHLGVVPILALSILSRRASEAQTPSCDAPGNRCEDPGLSNQQCQPNGRRLVPDPWVHDIALPGAPNDGIFGEPAIANGRLYAATISGHVYMLQP